MKFKNILTLGAMASASILAISCTRNLDEFYEYTPENILDDQDNIINDVVFNGISYSENFSSEFNGLLDIFKNEVSEYNMNWTSIFSDAKITFSIDFTKSIDEVVTIDEINISGDLAQQHKDDVKDLLEATNFFDDIEQFTNLYSTGAEGKTFYRNKLLQNSPIWLRSNAIDLITNSVTNSTLNIIYDYENPPVWTQGTASTIYEMDTILKFDKLDEWVFNIFWKLDEKISFSSQDNAYKWFNYKDGEDDVNFINIPFNVFGEEIVVSKNLGSISKGIADIRNDYEELIFETNLTLEEVRGLDNLSIELDGDIPYDIDGYYGLTTMFNGPGNILEQLSNKGIQLQRVKLLNSYIKDKFAIELKVREGEHTGFMRAEFLNNSW